MKTRKTLIAAAATMVLGCGQMALAAQHLHEDQWDKVNLYGNTTIAGDSVDDWGPWKEFVQPAAGAPTVALLGALGGDAYRPLPQVDQTLSDVCRAGDMCGYAVFYNGVGSDEKSRISSEGSSSSWSGYFPAVFGLSVQNTGQSVDGGDYYVSTTPVAGSWRVASLFGESAPIYGSSGDLMGTFSEGYFYGNYDYLYMNRSESSDYSNVTGLTNAPYNWWFGYYQTADVTVGWFDRYIYGTNSAGDGGENVTKTNGFFVAGHTTPLADVAALQAGNVVATYSGSNSGWWGGNPSQVSLTVNFGNSSWSGSWNGGSDSSNVSTSIDGAGRVNLHGQVGFNVTGGTVSGSNFSATSANLSALDGTVSGNVQGSFYGPAARTAAGVVSITKTGTSPETYTNGKLTDVFVAVKNAAVPSVATAK